MGLGQLAAEDIASTKSDMATVNAAADAINTAINNVRRWLDGKTWTGDAADAWMGDWNAQFGRLQSLLRQLPATEGRVVAKVTRDSEQMVRRAAQAQARAAQR